MLLLSSLVVVALALAYTTPDPTAPPTMTRTSSAVNTSKPLVLNETVQENGISFKAASWGFAPKWGASTPAEGARFLWAYVEAKNVDVVPANLPQSSGASLIYRGIKAERPRLDYESSDTYSGSRVYPDIGETGHLLYSVSLGLEAGEAIFSIEGGGKRFELMLEHPAQWEERHIEVVDVSLDCRYSTYSGGARQFECDDLDLSLKNDRLHVPVHEYDWTVELTLDGREVLGKGSYFESTVAPCLRIRPNQEKPCRITVNWKFDEDRGSYFKGTGMHLDYSRMIGTPGTYDAVVTIRSGERDILGTKSTQLKLPVPASKAG